MQPVSQPVSHHFLPSSSCDINANLQFALAEKNSWPQCTFENVIQPIFPKIHFRFKLRAWQLLWWQLNGHYFWLFEFFFFFLRELQMYCTSALSNLAEAGKWVSCYKTIAEVERFGHWTSILWGHHTHTHTHTLSSERNTNIFGFLIGEVNWF